MQGIYIANALLTEPANGKQKTNFANIKRKCCCPSPLHSPPSLSLSQCSAKGDERNENKLKMRLNAQKEIRKSLHL